MKKILLLVYMLSGYGVFAQVSGIMTKDNVANFMVDKNATVETKALFYNMKLMSKTKFTIGQQDAFNSFYYNIGGKSDIKKTTGREAGILGVDFSFITDNNNTGQKDNWYYKQEQKIIADVKEAYDKGMIVTFCWHLREPFEGKEFYVEKLDAYTKENAFKSILPGGTNHDVYKKKLDRVAQVAKSLKGSDGKIIPVIFRPFHEFDGSWFWWGADFCTPEEYKAVYEFTVEYLRDTKDVHNFLYAFSPDNKYATIEDYLVRYPGDTLVDLLGTDNYGDFDNRGLEGAIKANDKLKIISDLAKQKNKIAAMTETGYQITDTKKPIDGFFSDLIYKAMTDQDIELAYVLFWSNNEKAYFIPQPNMPDTKDFIDFTNKPEVILLDKLPSMYKLSKK